MSLKGSVRDFSHAFSGRRLHPDNGSDSWVHEDVPDPPTNSRGISLFDRYQSLHFLTALNLSDVFQPIECHPQII
jgi:hypothetical protein